MPISAATHKHCRVPQQPNSRTSQSAARLTFNTHKTTPRGGTPLYAALGNARRALAFSLGSFTLVIIFSFSMVAMIYQVMSTCHHSRPWRALASNAWWLLCQPSPQASRPTHLQSSVGRHTAGAHSSTSACQHTDSRPQNPDQASTPTGCMKQLHGNPAGSSHPPASQNSVPRPELLPQERLTSCCGRGRPCCRSVCPSSVPRC